MILNTIFNSGGTWLWFLRTNATLRFSPVPLMHLVFKIVCTFRITSVYISCAFWEHLGDVFTSEDQK